MSKTSQITFVIIFAIAYVCTFVWSCDSYNKMKNAIAMSEYRDSVINSEINNHKVRIDSISAINDSLKLVSDKLFALNNGLVAREEDIYKKYKSIYEEITYRGDDGDYQLLILSRLLTENERYPNPKD